MAFDLGEEFSISKVATVGKADDKNRYISSYALEYSHDGKKWDEYADLFGKRVSGKMFSILNKQDLNNRSDHFCYFYNYITANFKQFKIYLATLQ